jgi:AcrR family transcriptional regulator
MRTCVRNGIPAYIREKARELRVERRLSIVEIAERLGLPKATIYYWVRDIPLQRPRRANPGQRRGNRGMRRKYRELREAAYAEGKHEFSDMAAIPTFTDFVCLYIAEGYKRQRNTVALANSDPMVIALSTRWIRRFSRNPVRFFLQYHADQDVDQLCRFWGEAVGADPAEVGLQRKSNSNQLRRRTWRSRYGVLTVRACDTLFRARLQAWMDCLQETWLHSPESGA